MAKIGYDNTLNRSGGPSPLKGVFSAVGSVFKKKSKTKAKDAPKKNKGEGIGAYSKRLAESQRSGSGESSGDAVIAYTPLYNTDPDKKKKKKDRTIHLDNVNVDGKKLTGSMKMESGPLPKDPPTGKSKGNMVDNAKAELKDVKNKIKNEKKRYRDAKKVNRINYKTNKKKKRLSKLTSKTQDFNYHNFKKNN